MAARAPIIAQKSPCAIAPRIRALISTLNDSEIDDIKFAAARIIISIMNNMRRSTLATSAVKSTALAAPTQAYPVTVNPMVGISSQKSRCLNAAEVVQALL